MILFLAVGMSAGVMAQRIQYPSNLQDKKSSNVVEQEFKMKSSNTSKEDTYLLPSSFNSCANIEEPYKYVYVDENSQQAIVTLSVGIFESLEIKKVPFQITVDIEGFFRWNEDLDKNQGSLDLFLKQNAPAILYSYIRPIITVMTVEANMPPLVIPIMNFQKE